MRARAKPVLRKGTTCQRLQEEIASRRTFAIISHPDAGKTTLTEKLLLYTGSIQTAGSVKGKCSSKHAVSDWMDIEKERGISVTSSVLQFYYDGCCVNILDTPGHQDFSEDTYRTLMAADAAVMVIDAAKGVEAQTKKLFKVCTLRHIPIFTFVNKLDRESARPVRPHGRDRNGARHRHLPHELAHRLRTELPRRVRPPDAPRHRLRRRRAAATPPRRSRKSRPSWATLRLTSSSAKTTTQNLMDDIELLDGAGDELDLDAVRTGKLSPVFFGSRAHQLRRRTVPEGVPAPGAHAAVPTPTALRATESTRCATSSRASCSRSRRTWTRTTATASPSCAFARASSNAAWKRYHMQGGKKLKLATGTSLMADDRAIGRRGIRRRHRGFVRPRHLLYRRHSMRGKARAVPRHPDVRTGECSRAGHPGEHAQAQAVREGHGRTGAGRRHPDLPRAGLRHGKRHREASSACCSSTCLETRLKNEYGVEVRRQGLPYSDIRWIANDLNELDDSQPEPHTRHLAASRTCAAASCCCSRAHGT